MRILLLGSGGREHALAWKLSQSELCSELFIAPGNAGTLQYGANVDLKLSDFEAIHAFCLEEKVAMVIVGPEEPLVNGIVDFFQSAVRGRDIAVIGPSKAGAQLEGSKSFAKAFMKRFDIPTAAYGEFDNENYQEGIQYMQQQKLPIVLKADGLAGGKGVLICMNHVEAMAEFELMIQKSKFGEAGRKVVVEEFLSGIELSVFVLTDGKNYVILPEAKDYKRAGVGDTGLNTGGMGAVSPVPFATEEFMQKVEERIIRPTIEGLEKDNIFYQGIIFFGVIKVGEDPFLIEYNCRLGDPEAEVVIPRMKNDLVELYLATVQQKLDEAQIETEELAACTVVAVSGGYPGDFTKGYEIEGLKVGISNTSLVFHAATSKAAGKVLTNGGRVLCVTSYGHSIAEAVLQSKEVLNSIYFPDIYFRSDIGYEFI
ncbi:MAG: phosphoribosylamine--glycine ligase [Chitinophagaceae bacterium]